MQRMNRLGCFDGPTGCDEGLTGDLSAERTHPLLRGVMAAEEVHLDRLEVEQADQFIETGCHPRDSSRLRSVAIPVMLVSLH